MFLGQDANWDLRNYHWYNAWAFVNGRYLIDLLPSQTPFFYNPTLDVPFYLLASRFSATFSAFALGTAQGLNFVLLFMLAHSALRVPNPRNKVLACAAIAALGMLGGGGIAQIGTTFYDNITSLGLFLSALLVIANFHALMEGRLPKAAALAVMCGLPAGAMMGLKLPSVVFSVGLCGALLLVAGSPARRIFAAFCFGLGVMIGLALSLGHWSIFLYDNFGSPLFPYFNGLFGSPLAPPSSARDTQFIPHSLPDALAFPFLFAHNPKLVGEIAWSDIRIPLLYLLLPLAVALRTAFGRNPNPANRLSPSIASRYLLWTGAVSYFAWLPLFSIYRYLIPLEMLAPLLIVLAVGMLPMAVRTRALLAAFMLVAVAVSVRAGDWGRLPQWLDKSVKADVPAIADPAKTMVLLAGFEPYSHVLSSFPAEAVFVRIQSNFSSPEEDKGINKLLRERVAAHAKSGGRFMLLAPAWQRELTGTALKRLNLAVAIPTCRNVEDYLYPTKLELCEAK